MEIINKGNILTNQYRNNAGNIYRFETLSALLVLFNASLYKRLLLIFNIIVSVYDITSNTS